MNKKYLLILLIIFSIYSHKVFSIGNALSSNSQLSAEQKPAPGENKKNIDTNNLKKEVSENVARQSSVPQPPKVVEVYNENLEKDDAGLGEYIILKVNNLQQLVDSAKSNNLNIILYLDNRPINELYPDFIDTSSNKIKFYLSRKKSALESWDPIFRKPNPFVVHKKIPVSIGLEKRGPIASDIKDTRSLSFIVLRPVRTLIAIIFLVFVIISIYYLSKHRGMLCECVPNYAKSIRIPYSLGYCQMAFWFAIIVVFYLSLFLILNELPPLTPSVLILLGISSGTAITARILNTNNQNASIEEMNKLNAETKMLSDRVTQIENLEKQIPQPVNINELIKEKETKTIRLNEILIIKSQSNATYTPKESRGFFMDLLTDSDGSIAFNRFQIVIWTMVLGGIFIYNTWRDLAMPEFDNTLLGLMGISSGTYLGFKLPEQKK